jgi:hypothetical protein
MKFTSYSPVIIIYILATLVTNPLFMGDTVGYAAASLTRDPREIWEFGHLIWRPMGRAFTDLLSSFGYNPYGADKLSATVFSMIAINWVMGLIAALALYDLSFRLTKRQSTAIFSATAFIFSHGFLNFFQTGCSYIPGLSMLVLGLYFILRGAESERSNIIFALASGVALSLSVSFWFLYLWAIPAVLLAPLAIYGINRRRVTYAVSAGLAFAIVSSMIFLGVAAIHLGIRTPQEFKAWVTSASHGATVSGITRMLFGFARSFIHMGNDGIIFKRFLLKDPFNPVSLMDLARVSLIKLGIFYALLGIVSISLLTFTKGQRILLILIATAVPVLGFAVFWQGGDIERYLGLYPVLFLGLATMLSAKTVSRWLKYPAILLTCMLMVINVTSLANSVSDQKEQRIFSRIDEVSTRLNPQSILVTVHQQDEVWTFDNSYPFHPINRKGLEVHPLTVLGTTQVLRWREEFAAITLKTWSNGGQVWVTNRVMATRPHAEWNWVEGGDQNVELEFGESLGVDGFSLLLPSSRNEQILKEILKKD